MYIDKFINEYNKDKTFKENRLFEVISDLASRAIQSIEDDLTQLQSDVDSGRYSNQDIFDKIQKIKERL